MISQKWRIAVPLYDYKCEKCGYEIEELINPGDDDASMECIQCGGGMRREFPMNVSFRMTDNFIVGRERPSKEAAAKLEQYKADPSSDPYAKFRGN